MPFFALNVASKARSRAASTGALPGLAGRFAVVAWLAAVMLALPGCRSASTVASNASGGGPLPAPIEVDSLDVHDRCTSCHRELLEPGNKLAAQPHTVASRADCSTCIRRAGSAARTCHGGNGQATSAREAHVAGPADGDSSPAPPPRSRAARAIATRSRSRAHRI